MKTLKEIKAEAIRLWKMDPAQTIQAIQDRMRMTGYSPMTKPIIEKWIKEAKQ